MLVYEEQFKIMYWNCLKLEVTPSEPSITDSFPLNEMQFSEH